MIVKDFSGDVVTDEKTLSEHATDASVFRVYPKGVYFPKTVADIVSLVRGVEDGESISVRAGGTCMTGGSLTEGYIVNLTRYMNKVSIDPTARTATVEAGAYFRDIEEAARQHGLMFAPYPSSHLIAGIGGMIGNNASGEKSLRFGATIDNVRSLEVVLADGEVITTGPHVPQTEYEQTVSTLYAQYAEKLRTAMGKVKKVASGYRLDRVMKGSDIDLTPLFVGTQGTLGIVTKAVLSLVPIPQNTVLYLIPINSIHDLPHILSDILAKNPESVETFDIHTFECARTYMPDQAQKIERFFTPETTALILAQFDTDVDIHGEKITDPDIVDAAWKIRRSSYSLVRDHHREGERAVPCVEDSIVPIEYFDQFVQGLVAIVEKYGLRYAFHGHIADGALRIIPLFDFTDSHVAEKIIGFTREVVSLIKSLGGNLSADHSDGIIRSPFLREFYGDELYRVFEEIKKIFDPRGILNPHKKVGGSEEYIRKYIV